MWLQYAKRTSNWTAVTVTLVLLEVLLLCRVILKVFWAYIFEFESLRFIGAWILSWTESRWTLVPISVVLLSVALVAAGPTPARWLLLCSGLAIGIAYFFT